MLLIQNGHILDPYTGLDAPRDLLIAEDGKIIAIEDKISSKQAKERFGASVTVLDATGNILSPGFVDVHVHFRDPGATEREEIGSGAQAAAAGGFTTVVCMANTTPVVDNAETLQYILDRAQHIKTVHILQTCAITKGLKGEQLTDFEALLAQGAIGFTDDGVNLTSAGLCHTAMERAAALGAVLSFHEEDKTLVSSAGVNYGSAAARHFAVPGARPESEECMIARDIALALRTGAKVSFQHISSKNSVQLIRKGKELGAHIFAEVTPHHLSLTEDDVLEHGTNARMNPPLRREEDRMALIAGLRDGTIDMIATDHAPHTAADKAKEFSRAPSGIIGLETAFSVCNSYLVQPGYLTPMELVRCMSCNPAGLYGLGGKSIEVGSHAELVLADWNAEMVYKEYKSKSNNSPFTNKPLKGKISATVMGDQVIKATTTSR